MHLSKGTSLKFGSYVIESVLGQGGFGITYVAEQVGLGRKVAIKEFFMKELCDRDEENLNVSVPSSGSRELVDRFKAKFIKEARLIASMDYAGIINIYDVFEENGTAYYVMEYLPGGSLKDNIPAGGFPESVALRYVRQIADALRYIHEEKHVLHLDVKPSNVLMRKSGELVLIDFGISKHYDDDGGEQTSSSPVGVSRGYAPLEQNKAGGVSQFTPSTDIYSLGATLYNLLTEKTPPDAIDVFSSGLPTLPSEISTPVVSAIRKAMQPRREDRPQSVTEFMGMLDVSEHDVPLTPPAHPSPQTPQPAPPVNPEPDVTEADAPAEVSAEEAAASSQEFLREYDRLMATQRYRDAIDLCRKNIKTYGVAQRMLNDAMKVYFRKSGKEIVLPAFDGISYDWLTDKLISKGFRKMTMGEELRVKNVSLSIQKNNGWQDVRIKRDRIRMSIWTFMLCLLILLSLLFGIRATMFWMYEEQHIAENAFDGMLLCFSVSIILIYLFYLYSHMPFKTIRKVVSDALIKKWYEK